MLFNSFEYFFFLPLVVLLFFLLPQRWRNPFLLVASYYFYMRWKWEFGFLILATSFVNYLAGYRIAESGNKTERRAWLLIALGVSLGILFYFKYAGFFVESFASLAEAAGFSFSYPVLRILLPVGISFFTFQALSYTIDVYREKMHCEKNPVNFFLFVSFFPQLVAGPIERASHLLDQFREKHHFSSQRLLDGGKIILWGLFKKVVIADRLAAYTDIVYQNPENFTGLSLLLATLFFAFQIYCDFSGYSDIAIGSAHILGFRLMQNFNLPYLARSISDFWKRWHISLSSWFGDYVYKPMGGNRVPLFRWVFNIFTVFLVSGLWHGANWTFVVWGGLHACYYLVDFLAAKAGTALGIRERLERSALWKATQTAYVFIIVLFSWVFFRADSVQQAADIILRIFTDFSLPLYTGSSAFDTAVGLVLILVLYGIQVMQYRGIVSIYFSPSRVPTPIRWAGYALSVILIALLGVGSEQFIYFQF